MLELTRLALDERGAASLSYNLKHNVGYLDTILEQTLDLELNPRTGKVTGVLHVTELEANSVDAARDKLAGWCDRMAAALRGAARKEGDLPLFERRAFTLTAQPLWLQEAFHRLVQLKLEAETEDDRFAIKQWLDGHPMVLVPGLMDAVEAEVLRREEADPELTAD